VTDEISRKVLEAVERGELPRGGPSHIAARALCEDTPPGYFERWSEKAAERIRQQASRPRCSCASPAGSESRCERCGGWTA
jgi:hypothetical protein